MRNRTGRCCAGAGDVNLRRRKAELDDEVDAEGPPGLWFLGKLH